jgi:periplasmic divalent cation tolerance protein
MQQMLGWVGAIQGPPAKKLRDRRSGPVCDNRRPMPVRLVLSTCPDAETATRMARVLVDERLAACVSALPGVVSTYRWQGKVEQATEVQLLIKTSPDRLDALTARLRELHPYELPEVLVVETAGGLAAYADWVADQTRAD